MTASLQIRRAEGPDLDAMAALAAALVGFHHGLNPRRFFLAEGVAAGYRAWFERELRNDQAVLFGAWREGALVGYLYGRFEPRNWELLVDRHAALHDVFVADTARGRGVADALIAAFIGAADAAGYARVLLHTAVENLRAQRVFARHGFVPTMVEMTRFSPEAPSQGEDG